MEYSIVHVKQENLALYAKLLSDIFKETTKYTEKFLSWQYFENPAGPVVGFDAFYDGKLAAHYVTIPVIYTFQNKTIKGLLSLNTATDPAHQGKGLFLKLAKATYERAEQLDYKFVIGVANQNSTHGFVNKLGFDLVSKLEVKIYMGVLTNKKLNQNYFKAQWDELLMQWRLNNPEGDYYSSGDSVFSKTHLPVFKSLLTNNNHFNVRVKKIILNPLKISIGLNLNKPSLAIELPERFRPSPLNLIFKKLTNDAPDISAANCYFELINFDAY